MNHVGHFIANKPVPCTSGSPIFNPATGEQTGFAAEGSADDVDRAVAAARAALPSWATTGLQHRAGIMLSLREAIQRARDELSKFWVRPPRLVLGMGRASVRRSRVGWTHMKSGTPSAWSRRSVHSIFQCSFQLYRALSRLRVATLWFKSRVSGS